MVLKRLHTSSPLTVYLILVLSIVFLTPLYHSHNHAADNHQENNGEHVLLHDGAGHEGTSPVQQHNGSHLHIKKDIGRTDNHLRFKSNSLMPDLYAVTESPAFTEYLSDTLIKHTKALILRSNSRTCLTGLSPPAA